MDTFRIAWNCSGLQGVNQYSADQTFLEGGETETGP